MGCGYAATTSRRKTKASVEGKISKEDFILRRCDGFADDYSLDKCLGCGKSKYRDAYRNIRRSMAS